jgi:hypothetical protein
VAANGTKRASPGSKKDARLVAKHAQTVKSRSREGATARAEMRQPREQFAEAPALDRWEYNTFDDELASVQPSLGKLQRAFAVKP